MTLFGSLAALALAMTVCAVNPAGAASSANCSPAGGASFICGVTNVEDFAPVPDTKWVIGSDLAAKDHPQGYLYLFDTEKRTASAVEPSEIAIRRTRRPIPTVRARMT
jgi:hypothetical protein